MLTDSENATGPSRGSPERRWWYAEYSSLMVAIKVALPDGLQSFVDSQVSREHYRLTSEYVRDLIRRARGRDRLRLAILEDGSSSIAATAEDYLETLRDRVQST